MDTPGCKDLSLFVFFLMIRRPPRSTLFPYTTSSDLSRATSRLESTPPDSSTPTSTAARWMRSEEHTSELQSRPHLVCRLLLEKKKNFVPIDSRGRRHHCTTSRPSSRRVIPWRQTTLS